MSTVVTRIAPSPTGYLHFGLARTALFNYLYARKMGGTFIIRVEDTDTARNKPEYEADILEQLAWLGLTADATYRQSEQVERHKQCLQELIKSGKAYVSREPAKDDASREVEVVRLRNPGEVITFNDGIRGDITFDTAELKDFVIARSIDEPLYHFAVVVDDHDEGVTHVIRGDDHISNTPRQILILKALGFEVPEYTHLPLILMPDKSKMSKRKHETAVKAFREQGYYAVPLLNYLAHLGWTPPVEDEQVSLDLMAAEFDIDHMHKSGAVFDIDKLKWYNREFMLTLPENEYAEAALAHLKKAIAARNLEWNDQVAQRLVSVIKERVSVWADIDTQTAAGEYDYFFADPHVETEKIADKKSSKEEAAAHLQTIHEFFSNADEERYNEAQRLKDIVWDYASEKGRGAVLWPLRYALSGKDRSPDPFTIASIIGREATLRRIEAARRLLSA